MKNLAVIFLSLICFSACKPKTVETYISRQPVYDQINKTQIIRCGYVTWPPAFSLDVNNGNKSGVFYDVMQEVGKRLNLKIEWKEELTWATVIEAIKSKRVDMVCSGLWVNSTRARQVDFSAPVSYSLIYAYKSTKSPKQFSSLAELNSPQTTFGYIDGTTPAKLSPIHFNQAKMVSYPETTQISDLLNGLQGGKYDVILIDEASVQNYLKKNPGAVVKAVDEAVSFAPNVMLVPADETKLKAMVDNTIHEILYDGTIGKIMEKNGVQNDYKIPAKPYQD